MLQDLFFPAKFGFAHCGIVCPGFLGNFSVRVLLLPSLQEKILLVAAFVPFCLLHRRMELQECCAYTSPFLASILETVEIGNGYGVFHHSTVYKK